MHAETLELIASHSNAIQTIFSFFFYSFALLPFIRTSTTWVSIVCIPICVCTYEKIQLIFICRQTGTLFLDWITRERVTQHQNSMNSTRVQNQKPIHIHSNKIFDGIWFGFLYVFFFSSSIFTFTFTVPISSPWIYLSVENELLTKSTAVAAAAVLALSLHVSNNVGN